MAGGWLPWVLGFVRDTGSLAAVSSLSGTGRLATHEHGAVGAASTLAATVHRSGSGVLWRLRGEITARSRISVDAHWIKPGSVRQTVFIRGADSRYGDRRITMHARRSFPVPPLQRATFGDVRVTMRGGAIHWRRLGSPELGDERTIKR